MWQADFDRRNGALGEAGLPADDATVDATVDACLAEALAALGTTISVERNGEVFAVGEPAEYLYRVAAGVVRSCLYTEDGRRQIGSFYLPGDIFGFEIAAGRTFSAEAVSDCRLLAVRRTALRYAAERDSELCLSMLAIATRSAERPQAHVALLGRKSAVERVSGFLHALAGRQHNPSVVELAMSRQDIADHLGLTIETVSRTMTQLQDMGAISLDGSRRVRVPGACGAERPCGRPQAHSPD